MAVPFDTSGMLHTCGHKLVYAGIDNGCHVLVCLNKKCGGYYYRIPVEDPRKLPFPWETPREKVYKCTVCRTQITKEQALETFDKLGKAVCESCRK